MVIAWKVGGLLVRSSLHSTMAMPSCSLLISRTPLEKSAMRLVQVSLCVRLCYALAAFRFLSFWVLCFLVFSVGNLVFNCFGLPGAENVSLLSLEGTCFLSHTWPCSGPILSLILEFTPRGAQGGGHCDARNQTLIFCMWNKHLCLRD